jgi:carboxylesterase type B
MLRARVTALLLSLLRLHHYAQFGNGDYPASHLVDRADGRPAIVVTANYHLGMLGFLGSDELRKENPTGTTGNFGIEDQVN